MNGTTASRIEKATGALEDVERISREARQLLEEKRWLELANFFDNIEKAAQQGFNRACELQFRPEKEPAGIPT